MNSIKKKLVSSLIITSVLVGLVVLIVTPYMVKHEILEKVVEAYVDVFEKSITHYMDEYQSWGTAEDAIAFANSADFHLVEQVTDLDAVPIHLILLDQNGHVILGKDRFTVGSKVDVSELSEVESIYVKGEHVAYVWADENIPFSPWESAFIHTLEETLFMSVLIAIITILPFGIWKGNRLAYTLNHLIEAVNDMAKGNLKQEVPIKTNDEIGVLAGAFNSMNAQLVEAYRDLETSRDLIAKQAEQLKELSIKDELTGLNNRRFFNEEVQSMRDYAKRHKQPLALVLGDIDHFKKINDNFSHAMGDAVLKVVADILAAEIRSSDLVARYGGEEMVFALPNTEIEKAVEMMDRIRGVLERYPWSNLAEDLKVTMSFGISTNIDVSNFEKQLELADAQLYRAKEEGRNRVCHE